MGWFKDMYKTLRDRRGTSIKDKDIPTHPISTVSALMEPCQMALNMDAGRIIALVSEAEAGSTRDLFALYRDVIMVDSHIQSEWTKRKLAVLGDSISVLPFDKKIPADVQTAEAVNEAITGCKAFRMACSHMMDSSLYPISIVEKVYAPVQRGYAIANLIPVPYHLLDWTSGKLQIFDVDPVTGYILSTKHDPDPSRYIIHKGNLLTAPENWGGPMRSILFWWLLSAMSREWWARFLDRYGSPFLVGKFADTEGKNLLERAFSLATRLGGIVCSRETSIEIQKVSSNDSGDAYEKFLAICQREKSKLIIGQTLSAEAQPTGLGSGVSSLQGAVRDDIRKFDAMMLSDTLIHQLITQFCQINNLPGRVPKIGWGSQSNDELKVTGALMQSLAFANLELTDSGITQLSDSLGLSLQRRAAAPSNTPFSISSHDGGIPLSASQQSVISKIILESRSKEDAAANLGAYLPTLTRPQVISVIDEVLGVKL
jgi:phage gp29-like protein